MSNQSGCGLQNENEELGDHSASRGFSIERADEELEGENLRSLLFAFLETLPALPRP